LTFQLVIESDLLFNFYIRYHNLKLTKKIGFKRNMAPTEIWLQAKLGPKKCYSYRHPSHPLTDHFKIKNRVQAKSGPNLWTVSRQFRELSLKRGVLSIWNGGWVRPVFRLTTWHWFIIWFFENSLSDKNNHLKLSSGTKLL